MNSFVLGFFPEPGLNSVPLGHKRGSSIVTNLVNKEHLLRMQHRADLNCLPLPHLVIMWRLVI
jgi:hypothetical protein